MTDSVLLLLNLSVKLDLVQFNCERKTNINKVSTEINDNSLEGVNIDKTYEPPDMTHLSDEIKKLAKKFPTILKDDLSKARGFIGEPNKVITVVYF